MKILLAICVCFAIFCIGCSPVGIGTVPVTGSVTYKGEPIAEALVTFLPAESSASDRGASATTDAKGEFTLKTIAATKSGAMLGNYIVLVEKKIPVNSSGKALTEEEIKQAIFMPIMKNLLPSKYEKKDSTEFTVTVEKKKNSFKLELKD
jgi:hypothetical protein